MTRKEAIEWLKQAVPIRALTEEDFSKFIQAVNLAIDSLETDEAYQLEYERTTKNDLGVDLISRTDVLKLMKDNWHTHDGDWAMQESMDDIRALPSVTPQEPRCKDCKWWKDKDGVYRRGIGAESKCPINRREVMEGMGYCFMFEPRGRSDKE